jgi:hypothetical protein
MGPTVTASLLSYGTHNSVTRRDECTFSTANARLYRRFGAKDARRTLFTVTVWLTGPFLKGTSEYYRSIYAYIFQVVYSLQGLLTKINRVQSRASSTECTEPR